MWKYESRCSFRKLQLSDLSFQTDKNEQNWRQIELEYAFTEPKYAEIQLYFKKNIFNQLLFVSLCVLSTLYFNRPHKDGSKTLSQSDKSYWICQKCSFPFLTYNFSLRRTFFLLQIHHYLDIFCFWFVATITLYTQSIFFLLFLSFDLFVFLILSTSFFWFDFFCFIVVFCLISLFFPIFSFF